MKLPRRATAGGTTRTPVARIAASSRCGELGLDLVVEAQFAGAHRSRCRARRNDSSTAFLTHWLTVHWPTPWRSATRSGPALRSAMTCSTASRTSGGAVRRRQAGAVLPGGVDDWLRAIMAVLQGGWSTSDEVAMRRAASRHSSTLATSAMRTRPRPGLTPCALARQEASRQDGDIVLRRSRPARELGVVARRARSRPQIEAGVGPARRQRPPRAAA